MNNTNSHPLTGAFRIERDDGWQSTPLLAAAIHDGHDLRPEIAKQTALGEAARLREEDPFTAEMASALSTRIIGLRSRFEVDLNRPREGAVYQLPEDAWGLDLWKKPISEALVERSLAQYDAFYAQMQDVMEEYSHRFGKFVVFDLHSYNHRRDGARGAEADPVANPEVNIGTGSLDRKRWSPVIDRLIADLSAFDFGGRRLDVRENVKFRGGQFPRWIHERFPASACVVAIEWKKFWMDEWSGEADRAQLELIKAALAAAVPGVLSALGKMGE